VSSEGDAPPANAAAPQLLSHPLDPARRVEPIKANPDLQTLHRRWAAGSTPRPGSGLVGRLRRRAGAVALAALNAPEDDHALIGNLISTADALAVRCDELAAQLNVLETTLAEVVTALGSDLVEIRAALARSANSSPS
jgi:hypothetical protein